MPHRGGMQVGVQRAFGLRCTKHRETVVCGCGATREFDVNAIGQLIERCPRCRLERVYLAVRPAGDSAIDVS